MCRLFGFRSMVVGHVQRSLVAAENALAVQSTKHPDGWGLAYYINEVPHLLRHVAEASKDGTFLKVSEAAMSKAVLAHVRRATVGANDILNCHPFQYGRWVFAHNGDIPDFADVRAALLAEVDRQYYASIFGETDSEVLFYLFLTQLGKFRDPHEQIPSSVAIEAMRRTTQIARSITDTPGRKPALLTMIATNGRTMVAVRGGKELHWSTFKRRCPDRDGCPSLSPECEAPTTSGFVTHLVLSSEPIIGESVWIPLEEDEVIAVDGRMQLARRPVYEDEFDDGGTQPFHPLSLVDAEDETSDLLDGLVVQPQDG